MNIKDIARALADTPPKVGMTDQQRIAENCADIYSDAFNKLLDANRMLTNEVKRLRESQRWIPVRERLPEIGERVLTWNGAKHPTHVATYLADNSPANRWHYDDGYDDPDCYLVEVTHWMPLPAPPEKGEQP